MLVQTKTIIVVASLSLMLGACSSSGGASPIDGGETTGSTTSGTGADGDDSTGGGSTANSDSTAGDTAGTTTGSDSVGTTGSGTDVVGAAAIPELQGDWETGCLEYAGGFFRSETLSVIGARMLWNFSVFRDQECTVPASLGLVLSGSTVQQSATTVPTGGTREVSLGSAQEVDFHFDEATVDNAPIPEENFLGKDAYLARIEYDIVLVQDGRLYVGNIDLEGYDGTTPETRPISLDLLGQYRRAQ